MERVRLLEKYANERDVGYEAAAAKTWIGHATILFSDGEICSTKAGELLGMRTLHQFGSPQWPEGTMQLKSEFCGHACAFMPCDNGSCRESDALRMLVEGCIIR
jgi:hypothetical protein